MKKLLYLTLLVVLFTSCDQSNSNYRAKKCGTNLVEVKQFPVGYRPGDTINTDREGVWAILSNISGEQTITFDKIKYLKSPDSLKRGDTLYLDASRDTAFFTRTKTLFSNGFILTQ